MELSQEVTQPAPGTPLAVEIMDLLLAAMPTGLAGGTWAEQMNEGCVKGAADVMNLLVERGHYVPGAPPAAVILEDAKSFAERLTLSNLALRILNMLAWSTLQTPESKPARRWIDDYLEGKNHGPVGKPMLWPVRLPGMANLLRDWGFEPTPTIPQFVARSAPKLTVQ